MALAAEQEHRVYDDVVVADDDKTLTRGSPGMPKARARLVEEREGGRRAAALLSIPRPFATTTAASMRSSAMKRHGGDETSANNKAAPGYNLVSRIDLPSFEPSSHS
ncbi:hypothetical protein MRX96_054538 [Rhipicephalus microplus]